jgi:hypothetical protein
MVILGQHENNSADCYEIAKSGDYLYCVGYPGLDTVGIYEDPGAPGVKKLQWLDALQNGSKMNGVAAYAGHLYVANWSPWNGLRTFSVANPAHPVNVGQRSTAYHTWHTDVLEGVLHVAEGISGPGGIRVYDISDPAQPVYRKTLSPLQDANNHITNVARFGNYLYWGRGRWLQVYDASDPYNPIWQMRRDIAALCQYVVVHDTFLFVSAAEDSYYGDNPGGIYVFSLANPAVPVNVKGSNIPSWESGGGAGDLHIQGRYLLAPAGRWVRVLDVSDPYNVHTLAGLDPIPIVWDDDGDGIAESPTNLPNYTGPDFHDGYSNCVTGAGDYIYVGTTMDGFYSGSEPLFGSRVYSIQIAEGETEEPLDEVWIDLGSPDFGVGMLHPEGGDGDTEPVTKGGRACRQNVDPAQDFYFMFKVSDNFAYAGSNPDLYIGVTYFDEGTGSLTLQYDSPGEETSDKYKVGGSVALTGTNTWKLHVFHVLDAYFANRQNFDADFRIFGGAGNRFYLDEVFVGQQTTIPQIELSLTALETSFYVGGAPRNDAFLVSNAGGGTLWYSITDDAAWVSTSPDSGAVTDSQETISIAYDPSGLVTGDYTATISVADPNASNSPQTIDLTLHVLVTGDLDVDGDVDQEDFGRFQACLSGPGKLYAAGCEEADYDADLDVDSQDFALFSACMAGADQPPGC